MGAYERIATLIPSNLVSTYKLQLDYVGIKIDARSFTGFTFVFGIVLGILFGAIMAVFLPQYVLQSIGGYLPQYVLAVVFFIAGFMAGMLSSVGGILFVLIQMADSEGKRVERILPDALELISSNMKAGLTTERALIVSARPEFEPLSTELKEASKKIISSARVEDALLGIAKKIKSQSLERTMWLITRGIRSGGQIADLLIQLSSDLREENAMKDEVKANISMYVLMIFFAAAFGAPALFAISTTIVGILVAQTSAIKINPEQIKEYAARSQIGRFFGVPEIAITELFVTMFGAVVLAVTFIFASLTLGAMSTGNEKDGVKYIPVICIIGFALYFGARIVLASALSGMSGMIGG